MASKDHLSDYQFNYFNDGSHYTVGSLDPELSFDDMEHYNTLKADIAKNGIQRPLKTLHGSFLNEGHHRAVAARELGLEKIPVVNFTDVDDPEIYDTHEESTRWKLFK